MLLLIVRLYFFQATHPVMDKAKEWQMELLMEKLRSKAGQYKTFSESAKMLRMALLVWLFRHHQLVHCKLHDLSFNHISSNMYRKRDIQ